MTVNGFRSDQFFGIGAAGEDAGNAFNGSNYVVANANNPKFIYPNRDIITQDSSGKVTRTHMRRGYIRTLISSVQGNAVGIRKCAFQFNPQILTTSVAMTQDVLNAYQIDIGQFAVPTAGNSNFQFQLLFDRSMELNGPISGVSLSDLNPNGNPNTENIFSGADALDPSTIGVFRDIGELNAVIGAGLSYEQVQYAQQVASNQITVQALQSGLDPATDPGTQKALANVVNITSPTNYGNSAFLIPQPVRAVFTALFMVEGFVTNIDVTYTKFTTQMVPMQATVTLTMNAQYIGYAKKRTYVTDSLDAGVAAYAADQAAQQATVAGFASAMQNALGSVHVGLGGYDANSVSKVDVYLKEDGPNGKVGLLGAPAGLEQVFLYFEAPNAISSSASSGGVTATIDPVQTIIGVDSGAALSFSKAVTMYVYGPFDTNPYSSRAATLQSLPSNKLLFNATYWKTGETDWGKFISNNMFTDETPYPWSEIDMPAASLDGSKWFVVGYVVSITGSINGSPTNGVGTTTLSTRDLNTLLNAYVPLHWTDPTSTAATTTTSANTTSTSTTPSVGTSNAAASPPAPGSSSSVGKKGTKGKVTAAP